MIGRSPACAVIDDMVGATARRLEGPALNRKQRRTFIALFRRKRLRNLPPTLFSAQTKAFLGLRFPNNW